MKNQTYQLDLTHLRGFNRYHNLEEWTLIITGKRIFDKDADGQKVQCDGLTDFDENTIKIDGKLGKWEQIKTLIHELCHILLAYSKEHPKMDEEEIVWLMEGVLWEIVSNFFKAKLVEEMS